MKATAEQLAKIDFKKWESPGMQAVYRTEHEEIILCRHGSPVAVNNILQGWRLSGTWQTRELTNLVWVEVDKLDAFITSELAAIELAEKRERTKPEPGEGWEYCSREEAVDVSFFNDGAMLWRPWETLGVEHCGKPENYVFRRPKKVAPKLPTVKAPEGWRWHDRSVRGVSYGDKYGNIWLTKDGECYGQPVPTDRETRDAMAACVAAFDEVNKKGTEEKPIPRGEFIRRLVENPRVQRFRSQFTGQTFDWKFNGDTGEFMCREVGLHRFWVKMTGGFGKNLIPVEDEVDE